MHTQERLFPIHLGDPQDASSAQEQVHSLIRFTKKKNPFYVSDYTTHIHQRREENGKLFKTIKAKITNIIILIYTTKP
jgi:hypothetical protein